jgi:AcrR family transcriptional regulator
MTAADVPVRRDRRAERHAQTRREIVDAAWELARERGLSGWALRDVAEAVGMRAPSLYVYLESKNDLYDALFADGYAQLLEHMERVSRRGAPEQVLRRSARAFLDFCVADPARFQLLFLRTLPGFVPGEESYALATTALERAVEVLAAAGVTDPRAVDLWTAVMTGLASQQLSNDPGGNRWGRLVDDAVDLLVARGER